MKRLLRYFLVSVVLMCATGTIMAQSMKTHKVKKSETIYGIAHANGITEAQLRQANPGMESPDFILKKGMVINIPVYDAAGQAAASDPYGDVRQRTIRLGVMLPLHNINGDGRRMVEYYRGVLMACDSLKKEGISVDVHAWNTPDNGNIDVVLSDPAAAQCDLIIGPLYSKQVSRLSTFVEQNKSLLVIPFSINAPELYVNRNIFQIYQVPSELNESTSRRFADWFKDYHTIIVDCSDPNSTKGAFTAILRRQLEVKGCMYSLTSLQSTDANFAGAFSQSKENVVVLNSARTEDLEILFLKLRDLVRNKQGIRVSVFGYQEWMELAEGMADNFHAFNMYIPAPYFTNLTQPVAQRLAGSYRASFRQDMSSYTPKLALTGFDHAVFFLRGLHKYGKTFDGAPGRFGYQPVQTPLKFERIGNGGLQNRAFMFVHYKPDHQIETINY